MLASPIHLAVQLDLVVVDFLPAVLTAESRFAFRIFSTFFET